MFLRANISTLGMPVPHTTEYVMGVSLYFSVSCLHTVCLWKSTLFRTSTETSWPFFMHNVNNKRQSVDRLSFRCLITKYNSSTVSQSRLTSLLMLLTCDRRCHVWIFARNWEFWVWPFVVLFRPSRQNVRMSWRLLHPMKFGISCHRNMRRRTRGRGY